MPRLTLDGGEDLLAYEIGGHYHPKLLEGGKGRERNLRNRTTQTNSLRRVGKGGRLQVANDSVRDKRHLSRERVTCIWGEGGQCVKESARRGCQLVAFLHPAAVDFK